MEQKRYRQTIYQFKQFDPTKRFSKFDYSEMNWNEVNAGYCQKNEILKIDGDFYIFAGEINNDWYEKKPLRKLEHSNFLKLLIKWKK